MALQWPLWPLESPVPVSACRKFHLEVTCVKTLLFTKMEGTGKCGVRKAQAHTARPWLSQTLHSSRTAPSCQYCVGNYILFCLHTWILRLVIKTGFVSQAKVKEKVSNSFLLQVMMMVLPLLIFVLLPKVVNTSDPDMRREMEQSMNMLNSNHELPDVSEFMTRLFSSKSSGKSSSGSSKTGKSGAGKRR